MGSIRVMRDETAIKVCKAQEGSNIFNCCWSGPFSDSSYLDWVHGKGSRSDDHPKTLNFCNIEGAFLKFEIKV